MVKVPKALAVSHTPILALVPRSKRNVTELSQFASSFFARYEVAVGDERRVTERDMLEQVQRWLELQRVTP